MSSADQMLNTLDVVGPPGLVHSMAAMRSYIYRCVVVVPLKLRSTCFFL
jgi:sirohydrochlorin ferrochelatase